MRSLWPLVARWEHPGRDAGSRAELREIGKWLNRESAGRADSGHRRGSWPQSRSSSTTTTPIRRIPGVNEAVADLAVLAVAPRRGRRSPRSRCWPGAGCCGSRPGSPASEVDRRNRLTDGRLGVARMIGGGSDARQAHLGLIELAAAVCGRAEPACVNCPLAKLCRDIAGRRPAGRSCSERQPDRAVRDAGRVPPRCPVPAPSGWRRCAGKPRIRRPASPRPAGPAPRRRRRDRQPGSGPAQGGRLSASGFVILSLARRDVFRYRSSAWPHSSLIGRSIICRSCGGMVTRILATLMLNDRVEVGVEVQRGPRELGVLVDAADAVPAAPLDQPPGAVDVQALLPVPVQRPGQPLKFLSGAELVAGRQHEPLQRDRSGDVSDDHLETLQRQLCARRLPGGERDSTAAPSRR